MSYKSTVAARIYSDNSEEFNKFREFYITKHEKLSLECRDKFVEFLNQNTNNCYWWYRHPKTNNIEFFLYLKDFEWYSDSEIVQFFDGIFNTELYFVPSINIEFIRIGQDFDDVEVYYRGDSNQKRMSVTRKIELG